MELEHEGLTEQIIGAALNVHKALGPGFVESIYERALAVELRCCAIPFQRQLCVPVLYRGIEVGLHKLDLFIASQIVVELKAVKELADSHFVVVRSYLRAVGEHHGPILNFAKPRLEIKRVMTRECT